MKKSREIFSWFCKRPQLQLSSWYVSNCKILSWRPIYPQIYTTRGILQKLGHLKFCVWVFCLEMVKHPQTYPLIPKIPLGWSIKSKFWRIFKYTFIHVKYVVQRFVPRDLIFWSFAYCLTISESSCQHGSDGTQIWASNSMVSS